VTNSLRQSDSAVEIRTPVPAEQASATVESLPAVIDVPVLAFGSGLTALGVLRSLHEAGVAVYSVCPRGDLVSKSRWYRPPPSPELPPEPGQLTGFLHGLPLDRAVLFPCSDDWTRAISELPGSLKQRFPASVSDVGVIQTMTDKWRFSELVDCLDIPRPRTLRANSMAELSSLDEADFRDMFLKPIDSQEFSRRNNVKAFRLEGKQHALEIMEQVTQAGGSGFPILLQEYIPGPPTKYFLVDGFVDRNRQIRAFIARRRLTQYPPYFGNSSRSETIPLDEVRSAVESVKKLWAAVNYRGIFDAEFKYDDRDGQFKILEVNARPWWFVEFATRCGADLCRMAYTDALGLPVATAGNYDVGRRCVYLTYDLAAHLGTEPGLSGVFRWLKSFRGIEDIVFRWDDPWPGLHSLLSALKNYRRRRR
jgi:D-aspartate ligase